MNNRGSRRLCSLDERVSGIRRREFPGDKPHRSPSGRWALTAVSAFSMTTSGSVSPSR